MTTSIQSSVLPIECTNITTSAVARKRRRQTLESQRSVKTEIPGDFPIPGAKKMCVSSDLEKATSSDTIPDDVLSSLICFPRKVSDAANVSEDTGSDDEDCLSYSSSIKSKAKRPQMRYEPDVPMTKEAAASWRREQRRKRNRESAAASRQRQRDRITELETEVDGWKDKFEAAVERLRKLEALSGVTPLDLDACGIAVSKEGSKNSASINMYSDPPKTFSDPLHLHCDKDTELLDSLDLSQLEENEQHLNEKISRPA